MFFFPVLLSAQDEENVDSLKISRVMIIGNKATKENTILRELSILKDSIITDEQIKEDENKLTNLGIFNSVNFEIIAIDTSKKNYCLLINVIEGPRIIPIPLGGIKEGELKKIWGGLALKLKNMRGINEESNLSFGLGYEPFVEVSYKNPWVGDKAHFFVFGNFGFHKYVNKDFPDSTLSEQYKENLTEYTSTKLNETLGIGKYFGRYMNLSISAGYTHNDIPDYKPGRALSENGSDDFAVINIDFNYDKRNDVTYTLYGTYIDIFYSKYGIFNSIDFNRLTFDVRKFIPIKIYKNYFITYAIRFYNVNTFGGYAPDYLKASLGDDIFVRGFHDKLYKGDNIFIMQSEVRIPIIQPFLIEGKKHFIIKSLPILKDYMYKYGLYCTLFYDIGGITSNLKEKPYSRIPFKNGYGIGLNAILPFDFVGRVDLAVIPGISKLTSRFSIDLKAFF